MNQGSTVAAADQRLLQLVYDLMNQRGAWPTFTAVDLRVDRDLGIEDAQAALLAIPHGYVSRPWHARGFSDSDEVRLTVHGVAACAGGQQDLDLVAQFVAWVVKTEGEASDEETPLVAKSVDFAAYMEMPLGAVPVVNAEPETEAGATSSDDVESSDKAEQTGPAQDLKQTPEVVTARLTLSRLRVLVDLLPHFWVGVGWQQGEPWRWELTVDRRRLRPYRHLSGRDELLEYADSVERERFIASNVGSQVAGSVTIFHGPVNIASTPIVEAGVPASARSGDLDVLLPVLRAEIIEVSAELLSANRFDDAIFAAFRRARAPATDGKLVNWQRVDQARVRGASGTDQGH